MKWKTQPHRCRADVEGELDYQPAHSGTRLLQATAQALTYRRPRWRSPHKVHGTVQPSICGCGGAKGSFYARTMKVELLNDGPFSSWMLDS